MPYVENVEDSTKQMAAWLSVDAVLGEYDATTLIRYFDIVMLAPGESPRGQLLSNLKAEVEALQLAIIKN